MIFLHTLLISSIGFHLFVDIVYFILLFHLVRLVPPFLRSFDGYFSVFHVYLISEGEGTGNGGVDLLSLVSIAIALLVLGYYKCAPIFNIYYTNLIIDPPNYHHHSHLSKYQKK